MISEFFSHAACRSEKVSDLCHRFQCKLI